MMVSVASSPRPTCAPNLIGILNLTFVSEIRGQAGRECQILLAESARPPRHARVEPFEERRRFRSPLTAAHPSSLKRMDCAGSNPALTMTEMFLPSIATDQLSRRDGRRRRSWTPGKPPFPRRIRRVNRAPASGLEPLISVQCSGPDSSHKAAQDVSNHCHSRLCGSCGCCAGRGCIARARANRQYFFGSRAASAGRTFRADKPPRRRRRGRGAGSAPARTRVAGADASAVGAGRSTSRSGSDPAIAAATWNYCSSTECAGRSCRRATFTQPATGPATRTATATHGSACTGDAATGGRGRHRAAGPEGRQQEGRLLRSRQDHRPHHPL